jgi:acyl-CoA synthetase (AMP-forming)/AMP-acid ligase II
MAGPSIGYHAGQSALNNVISFLEAHRKQRPEGVVLLAPIPDDSGGVTHRPMTYSELATSCETLAARLQEIGIGFGDRVFVFVPMSEDLYVTMFAVQRIGAIAVFLDSWARREVLSSCITQVMPKAMIAPEAVFDFVQGVREVDAIPLRLVTGNDSGSYAAAIGELASGIRRFPVASVESEHTALVTFTTGSSGAPKGANRTHRFLAAQHYALDRCIPYEEGAIDLPVFPIFSLNNIAAGITTVLPAIDLARPGDTDGASLAAQIQDTGARYTTLSPSLMRQVISHLVGTAQTLESLVRIATGGAPISSRDVASMKAVAPKATIHVLYGSTEVEPIAHLPDDEMAPESSAEGVCVGRLVNGLTHKLIRLSHGPIELDASGMSCWELPPHQAGELVVAGEHVCRSYYENPEAFRRAKIVDGDGTVWHRTGDVCRFDEEDRLWVVGRVHNAIFRNGEYLFPVRPEIIMNELDLVQSAAYLGLPDPRWGERAVAAVCLRPGVEESNPERAVRQALEADGITVDQVVIVDEIPLDPRHHSKVEYTKLRQKILDTQV